MKRRSFLQTILSTSMTASILPLAMGEHHSSFRRAIYGFSSKNEPFTTMDESELIEWLQEHAINAVFVYSNEKEEILKLLNEAGIHCYQEFTVFASRRLYQEHPEWRPITKEGEEMQPDGWYYGLNPNHPTLRKKRLDDLGRRLENPWIQGFWLDFIRFPVRWEKKNPRIEQASFDEHSLNQFEKFIGEKLSTRNSIAKKSSYILEEKLDKWTSFKIESIRSWVEQANALIKEKRPNALTGLFGVPWREEDFHNAIHRIVGQDFQGLSSWVDVFSPMVYHRLLGRDVDWIATVTKSVKQQTNKQVWPIVQAMSQPDSLSAEEFREALWTGASTSKTGVILFTAKYAQEEERWEDVKQVFRKCDAKL